jgi:phosphoglycolate phosphatase
VSPFREGALWLFDIDGTIVGRRPGPDAHGHAMVDAVSFVVGREVPRADVSQIASPGMTDWNILVLAVEQATGRIPSEHTVRGGLDFAARRYPALLAAVVPPRPLDGALEARSALLEAGARVALVTGNVEQIAVTKLGAAGLASYHEPSQGGFGDQARERPELVRIATERARNAGWRGTEVVVVGDTPRDIDCAHANGARAIAVTTGPYDRSALSAADQIVDSLTELRELR